MCIYAYVYLHANSKSSLQSDLPRNHQAKKQKPWFAIKTLQWDQHDSPSYIVLISRLRCQDARMQIMAAEQKSLLLQCISSIESVIITVIILCINTLSCSTWRCTDLMTMPVIIRCSLSRHNCRYYISVYTSSIIYSHKNRLNQQLHLTTISIITWISSS